MAICAVLERDAIREARASFPGPVVPKVHCGSSCGQGCRRDHAGEYDRWVRKMAMWAFAHGTILLAAAEIDAGIERVA